MEFCQIRKQREWKFYNFIIEIIDTKLCKPKTTERKNHFNISVSSILITMFQKP